MSESSVIVTLRERRAAAGLSQSELANRAGVSRQAVMAIEAGRQVPSTSLALHLARALRCSVEDLFALSRGPLLQVSLASADTTPSSRVAIGRVDGVWAAHPVCDSATPGDGLVVGDVAKRSDVAVEPLADLAELEKNVLVAGCAPLLGLLAGRLGRRYDGARATWVAANSARSLELLEEGLVHIAGLHLVETDTLGGHEALVRHRFPEQTTVVISLTQWRQGLVVPPGNPLGIRTAEDILRPEVRFAGREDGSGAQKLIQRLLGDRDNPSSGIVASGHADVARLVRWGVADVGVAIEAAAIAEGLDFIPLSEERFDLLVPEARLDVGPVARLLELLDTRSFRAEASRLPGYDMSTSGHAATVSPR